MSFDYLKGRKCMVWTFMGNARMYQALTAYGDRLSQVGLFSLKVAKTGIITESDVAISDMLTYINRYPHIKWLLTIANDGASSIFSALRDNTDGAQDTFLSEIVRIMKKYPWCDGIDIDLERGGEYSTHAASTAMFRNIYNTVKGYDKNKLMNICLPGMTSVNGSVGGENWCAYADLNPYCDTEAIMSYGMAWAGSAPSPEVRHQRFRDPEAQSDAHQERQPDPDRLEDKSEIKYGYVIIISMVAYPLFYFKSSRTLPISSSRQRERFIIS